MFSRCNRSVVVVAVMLATVLGMVDAAVTARPVIAQEVTEPPDWLTRINDVRVGNALPAAVAEPAWVAGIEAHLRYLRLTPPESRKGLYANAHYENPESPYYTPEGDTSGRSSNLGYAKSDVAAIDSWLSAPFHAIGIMRPGLKQAGYARDDDGNAGLDVLRGLDPSVERKSPVFFPAPQTTTSLSAFRSELPNPLESCRYERGGLPLIALLPQPPVAGVTATLTNPDGSTASGPSAELCVITADTWESTDTVYGPTGQSILDDSNAVIVIAPRSLAHGEHQVRLVQNGREDVSWSFSVQRPVRLSVSLERTDCGVPSPGDVSVLTAEARVADDSGVETDQPLVGRALVVDVAGLPAAEIDVPLEVQNQDGQRLATALPACQLVPASVSTEGTPLTAAAGGTARVLGRLTQIAADLALPQQEITLLTRKPGVVEWSEAGTATTDDDGRFGFDISDVSSFEYQLRSKVTPAADAAVSNVGLVTAIRRFAGADRYVTAAAVSRGSFPGSADDVFIVTGQNWPDALGAGAAAAEVDGPVLPVQASNIPGPILDELDRLKPRRAWVVGGTSAVTDTVIDGLRERGIDVERVSGEDRYSTAAAVAAKFFVAPAGAYYVSGANYADALGGGAAAAKRGWPLLLTALDSVPAATPVVGRERIALGGTAAISDAVVAQLQARRVAGGDRFATAAATALDAFTTASTIHLATGLNFPDALAGTVAAARDNAPLLLTRSDCVAQTINDAAKTLGGVSRVVLGGTAVVSDQAANLTLC